ncbi:hypothetical protein BDF19DRAFT_462248 [Syncephalis fuscata]|nr:hypothetical protein BDF19DRAFT_462248 [Syncephalis fuscata]
MSTYFAHDQNTDSESNDSDYKPASDLSNDEISENETDTEQIVETAELTNERRNRVQEAWLAMGNSTATKIAAIPNDSKSNNTVKEGDSPIHTLDTTNTISSNENNVDALKASSSTTTATDIITETTTTSTNSTDETKNEPTVTAAIPNAQQQKSSAKHGRRRKNREDIIASYLGKSEAAQICSKSDWDSFVDREGIRDELTFVNKDGYLEKQAFLDRAADRGSKGVKAMKKTTRR